MKISVYTKEFLPESGGAYSFTSGIIERMQLKLGKDIKIYPRSYLKKIFSKFNNLSWLGLSTFFDGSDFVYFPSLDYEPVVKRSVFNVWDMCHLDHPESPDIKNGFTYDQREALYSRALENAYLITTGTEYTKRKMIEHYSVDGKNILVIPLPVRDVFFKKEKSIDRIIKEKYIFYPAQFWNHKNHGVIIEALKALKEVHGLLINAVFSGSDKGALAGIKKLSKSFGVESQVQFVGFVSEQDLINLYDNAEALVYPSFFGPDNIPPLEAMARNCPVIYADIDGAKEFYNDSVEFFDPNDAKDLSVKISRMVGDCKYRSNLIVKGVSFVKNKRYNNYVDILMKRVFK